MLTPREMSDISDRTEKCEGSNIVQNTKSRCKRGFQNCLISQNISLCGVDYGYTTALDAYLASLIFYFLPNAINLPTPSTTKTSLPDIGLPSFPSNFQPQQQQRPLFPDTLMVCHSEKRMEEYLERMCARIGEKDSRSLLRPHIAPLLSAQAHEVLSQNS
jgi:hypothetical protein